jgi:hypothetical protein
MILVYLKFFFQDFEEFATFSLLKYVCGKRGQYYDVVDKYQASIFLPSLKNRTAVGSPFHEEDILV